MLKFDSPIQFVPKVGPKYKILLEKLEIFTVKDILYHFPTRYEDFSTVKDIASLVVGERVTIRGILSPVTNVFTRNGKRLTRSELVDHTGKIALIWFNQHYLKNTLVQGSSYYVAGEVSEFNGKLTIVSPELEIAKETTVNTGRLVPVYPETQGVSSKWIRSRINDLLPVLESQITTYEIIPQKIKDTYKLKDFQWAIKNIHFPETKETAESSRNRFAFEELLLELLKVEKRRKDWNRLEKGKIVKCDLKLLEQFKAALPFELTISQQKAIEQVFADLESSRPMNRLLEGDVGAGKTVVAMAASVMVAMSGQRVIYLAPTEILAKQHLNTYNEVLKTFNLKIGYLTASLKDASDDSQIIIGTHALLFQEIYKNVGLVIIDEQQRFGVEQRGKLMEMAKDGLAPNLLTITATPIPRTLALTLYGDLDISVISPAESKQRKVETKVVPNTKRDEVYQWISQQNTPTFVVCPLIDPSESGSLENVKSAQAEYINLQKYFSKEKIGLLHGRMKPAEKEQAIKDFTEGVTTVLVSTPVIEVGIDIPDASIMVIESGERYGLASLHQLRGRIGRMGQSGNCLVFMSNYSKLAYSRLKNLETINDGLKLAEIDMRLRGQGDIFSTIQHGYRKFKIASFDDLNMLENVKNASHSLIDELDTYPVLKNRLEEVSGRYVRNN